MSIFFLSTSIEDHSTDLLEKINSYQRQNILSDVTLDQPFSQNWVGAPPSLHIQRKASVLQESLERFMVHDVGRRFEVTDRGYISDSTRDSTRDNMKTKKDIVEEKKSSYFLANSAISLQGMSKIWMITTFTITKFFRKWILLRKTPRLRLYQIMRKEKIDLRTLSMTFATESLKENIMRKHC